MSNAAKIVLLFLLAAVAGGAYLMFAREDVAVPTPTPTPSTDRTETSKPRPPEGTGPVEVARVETPLPPDPERTRAGAGTANGDAKQGVRGIVRLPNRAPAANVRMMLVPSATNDPIQVFLQNKSGQATPIIAETYTDANGEYVLGLPDSGKRVDLRCVPDDYPEVGKTGLQLRSGDWHTQDLTLENGILVQGRVVDARSKGAIANATVFLSNSSQSHSMVATPGRERGVTTTTDANGFFRFVNGPRLGLVTLTAEADGFAAGTVANQQLRHDAPNDYTIEVTRGQPLRGVVVDSNGTRISSAKVVANSLSPKAPQNETIVTDSDGRFEFPSLYPGPYKLSATAARFADAEMPLALTGEDVKLVMATQGSVHLKVLTADGRPVKNYRLSLKRSFPNNPQAIGNVIGHPDRNITPADYPRDLRGEFARIDGLPGGDFCFQITEGRHAKTLSPPFTVAVGADPIEVTATLTLGAELFGSVIDDRGQPVAGAVVVTDMNGGLAANSGILDMFRSMIPEKHTTRKVTTDAQGRFRLDRLSFADYMLRVSHPDFCEGVRIDIKLEHEGQKADAGVIQLMRGAVVTGLTTVDGQPAGQIKVTVAVPLNAAVPGPDGKPQLPEGQILFSAYTMSDGDGSYTLQKRVPPGTYKVTAQRQSADSPFMAILDVKQTEQQLVVVPGQDSVRIDFNLPSR